MRLHSELRNNAIIQAWISEYQKSTRHYDDCGSCGWPHNSILLCGSGSTFGLMRVGGNVCYIDSSNVEYMLQFIEKLGQGFHWKNDVFFDVEGGSVIVRHIEFYNGNPSVKIWTIPVEEWKSITTFIDRKLPQPISPQSDEMLRFGIDALNGYVETNETLMDGPGFAPYRKWYAAEKARRERNVEAK